VRQIDVARLMMRRRRSSPGASPEHSSAHQRGIAPPRYDDTTRVTPPQTSSQSWSQETDELLKHVDSIKANYGDDVLKLTVACKYIERLLANTRIPPVSGEAPRRHAGSTPNNSSRTPPRTSSAAPARQPRQGIVTAANKGGGGASAL